MISFFTKQEALVGTYYSLNSYDLGCSLARGDWCVPVPWEMMLALRSMTEHGTAESDNGEIETNWAQLSWVLKLSKGLLTILKYNYFDVSLILVKLRPEAYKCHLYYASHADGNQIVSSMKQTADLRK